METVLTIESDKILNSLAMQHNNHPSSEGFIVMIEVDPDTKLASVARELEDWVSLRLIQAQRNLHVHVCWRLVGNVRRDQNVISNFTNRSGKRVFHSQNLYQIVVCTRTNQPKMINPQLFHYSQEHHTTPIHPATILRYLQTGQEDCVQSSTCLPKAVRGFAVSGVDRNMLRDQWSACISETQEEFDVPGLGVGRHLMRILRSTGNHDQTNADELL